MDQKHIEDAAEEHAGAEEKLDIAEEAVRKALAEIQDVSRGLKERMDAEEKQRKFPIDDDPPGDVEEESPKP